MCLVHDRPAADTYGHTPIDPPGSQAPHAAAELDLALVHLGHWCPAQYVPPSACFLWHAFPEADTYLHVADVTAAGLPSTSADE